MCVQKRKGKGKARGDEIAKHIAVLFCSYWNRDVRNVCAMTVLNGIHSNCCIGLLCAGERARTAAGTLHTGAKLVGGYMAGSFGAGMGWTFGTRVAGHAAKKMGL